VPCIRRENWDMDEGRVAHPGITEVRPTGSRPRARSGRPTGYPAELEADVLLSDGRHVHVRPILPSDGPALAAAVASADAETLRLRFLGWRPVLDDASFRHLVEVDYQRRLALVAFDSADRGVGIARYEGRPDEDLVEIAIAVDPDWRRVGLGHRLLTILGEAAATRGIRRLVAAYSVGNHDVEGLLRSCGLPYRTLATHGVVEVQLELPPIGSTNLAVQPPA